MKALKITVTLVITLLLVWLITHYVPGAADHSKTYTYPLAVTAALVIHLICRSESKTKQG